MKTIIKKAIEGGWRGTYLEGYEMFILDPLFWQALGKACGWEQEKAEWKLLEDWQYNAMKFHEINLTEGWEKAVEYLLEITK